MVVLTNEIGFFCNCRNKTNWVLDKVFTLILLILETATTCNYFVCRKIHFAMQILSIKCLWFKKRNKSSEVGVVSRNNVVFGRRGATCRWGKGNNAGEG